MVMRPIPKATVATMAAENQRCVATRRSANRKSLVIRGDYAEQGAEVRMAPQRDLPTLDFSKEHSND
jgi:hypothetical protein